eukprot:3453368-Ditylum_brightwellii.AAC.1
MHYNEVVEFMDNVLPELYKKIRSEHKLKGYEYPVCVLPKATRTQLSYVEVLKNKYTAANPQEESTKYDQPPEREQKRRTVKLVVQSLEAQENTKAATEAEMKK